MIESVNRWDELVYSAVVASIFFLAWRRYPVRGTFIALASASISLVARLVFPMIFGFLPDETVDTANLISLISVVAGVVFLIGSILLVVALRNLIRASDELVSVTELEGDVQ